MRQLSAQRRKVVVLAAMVACLSGIGPLLTHGNHALSLVWIGCMAVMLVLVIFQFTKLRRQP